MVNLLHAAREPLDTLPAIYFVEPSPANIQAIVADFTAPAGVKKSKYKPHYACAHLFFTGSKLPHPDTAISVPIVGFVATLLQCCNRDALML